MDFIHPFIISASVQTLVCGVFETEPNISLSYLYWIIDLMLFTNLYIRCSIVPYTHRNATTTTKNLCSTAKSRTSGLYTFVKLPSGIPTHEIYVYCIHSSNAFLHFLRFYQNICLFIVKILTWHMSVVVSVSATFVLWHKMNVSIAFHKLAISLLRSFVRSFHLFNCSLSNANKNHQKPIYLAKIVCTISTLCIYRYKLKWLPRFIRWMVDQIHK